MVTKLRVGARAAADRDRAVRQLAVHRGQAERLPLRTASEIWRDTDNDRTGMLPFVFEDGFGFERYVDYALDVPMYFVKRDGRYHRRGRQLVPRPPGRPLAAAAGRARHDVGLGQPPLDALPRGAAEALPGDARRRRWARGRHGCGAAGASGSGILYDDGVARRGLGAREGLDRGRAAGAARRRAAPGAGGDVPRPHDARRRARVLALARRGCARRNRPTPGPDETRYLEPLDESSRAASHRRTNCWRSSTAVGRLGRADAHASVRIERGARRRLLLRRPAASDRLSSEEMMCSASASASARALVRIAHQADAAGRQFGEAVGRREHTHARAQSRLRQHRHRSPDSTAGADRARHWRWNRARDSGGRASPGIRSRRGASSSSAGRAPAAAALPVWVE